MFTLTHSRSRIAAALTAVALSLFAGAATLGATPSAALAASAQSQTHA